MSAEGTALFKIFGGARKIEEGTQGVKLQNPRQISQSEDVLPAVDLQRI